MGGRGVVKRAGCGTSLAQLRAVVCRVLALGFLLSSAPRNGGFGCRRVKFVDRRATAACISSKRGRRLVSGLRLLCAIVKWLPDASVANTAGERLELERIAMKRLRYSFESRRKAVGSSITAPPKRDGLRINQLKSAQTAIDRLMLIGTSIRHRKSSNKGICRSHSKSGSIAKRFIIIAPMREARPSKCAERAERLRNMQHRSKFV